MIRDLSRERAELAEVVRRLPPADIERATLLLKLYVTARPMIRARALKALQSVRSDAGPRHVRARIDTVIAYLETRAAAH